MKIIQDFIALLEEDEWYAWFQQNGATTHKAEKIMDVEPNFSKIGLYLNADGPGKKPRSFTARLFLRVYLKINVYRNKPNLFDELKIEIKV